MYEEFTIEVNVTQKHIDNGLIAHVSGCPIALAVLKSLNGNKYLEDHTFGVYNDIDLYLDGTRMMRAPLPPNALDFRVNFDAGNAVEPISFSATFHKRVDFSEE